MRRRLFSSRNTKLLIGLIGAAIVAFVFLIVGQYALLSTKSRTTKIAGGSNRLIYIAKRRASVEAKIMVSYFDLPFLNMALNFYETSIKRLNITNFLFTTSHPECCLVLNKNDKDCCIVYKRLPISSHPSSIGHKNFARKSNIRNKLILDLLNANMKVLYSDVDIYLFKNPFDNINCSDCDIAVQVDGGEVNSGFVFARPTNFSKQIYFKMNQLALSNDAIVDQHNLNIVTRNFSRYYKDFKLFRLPNTIFLNGAFYFSNRVFVDDKQCNECVQIHNNFIISIEAKEYRAKEAGFWDYDGDQYFSNPFRKYLIYENLFCKSKNPLEVALEEHESFISALAFAQILNRTLILPTFHCDKHQKCSLLDLYSIQHFYAKFGTMFREHSFLKHKKVPEAVVKARSRKFIVLTNKITEFLKTCETKIPDNLVYLVPKDINRGATDEEIINWFGNDTIAILQFHSLYGSFYRFNNDEKQKTFQNNIFRGLKFRPIENNDE